ncbi:amino acid--tRNA ligase-related protein, partial [Rhizobium leguminosarum]|uniref:amino acid--tRNA ligase-related protein n=1 Tax=Rhizobium leguminosarum TaxID=384 RepID=UPI003F9E55D4
VSTRHNPEFTLLECYWAYADYEDIMDLVERLFDSLALSIHGTTEVDFGDKRISFKGPFKRVPMPEAVKEATGIDFRAIKTEEEARAAAKAAGFAVEKDWT